MLKASNIHYEMAGRVQAVSYGGIGAMHLMVQRQGLIEDINENPKLLKVHLPYHESDHVLNIAYNILAGGVRLEDIELRRQDENFLNGLDAQRIPDPTTAGDFTRRFDEADILQLQECFNRSRLAVWKVQPKGFLAEAFIDVDGTIARTLGECKEGIGLSYKGIWGYAPLMVSLANGRCDQENVIEQLKNGVNAMRMPVNDRLSNWAYMVMTALAWNLKSWYGLLTPDRARGLELVRMEFRRFLQAILLIPCQVVRTARRVIYRVLGYNGWLKDFFATWERLQRLVLVE
jgi:hypothetical protein